MHTDAKYIVENFGFCLYLMNSNIMSGEMMLDCAYVSWNVL